MKSISRDLVNSVVEAILDMVDSLVRLDPRIWLVVTALICVVNVVALWVL